MPVDLLLLSFVCLEGAVEKADLAQCGNRRGPDVLYIRTHGFGFEGKILGKERGGEVPVMALCIQAMERCGSGGKGVLLGSTEVSLSIHD